MGLLEHVNNNKKKTSSGGGGLLSRADKGNGQKKYKSMLYSNTLEEEQEQVQAPKIDVKPIRSSAELMNSLGLKQSKDPIGKALIKEQEYKEERKAEEYIKEKHKSKFITPVKSNEFWNVKKQNEVEIPLNKRNVALLPEEHSKLGLYGRLLAPKMTQEEINKRNALTMAELKKEEAKELEKLKSKRGSFLGGAVDTGSLGLARYTDDEIIRKQQGLKSAFDISKEANPKTYIGGQVAGYLVPSTAAEKAAGALIKGTKLTTKLARGAVTGGGMEAVEGIVRGESAKDIVKRATIGTVLGAGAEGVGHGITSALAKSKAAKAAKASEEATKATTKTTAPTSKPNLSYTDKQNETLSKLNQNKDIKVNKVKKTATGEISVNVLDKNGYNIDVVIDGSGKSYIKAQTKIKDSEKAFDEFIKENPLAGKQSGNAGSKAVPVAVGQAGLSTARTIPPKTTLKLVDNIPQTGVNETMNAPKLKQRGFERTLQNSAIMPDILKQHRAKTATGYEPISNKDIYEKATQEIEKDFERHKYEFLDNETLTSADDVAKAEALIAKSIQNKDYLTANRLSSSLAARLTTAGQMVQAASIIKRLSPDGMLLFAQRTINKANRELGEKLGKKANEVKLSDDETREIMERMTAVQSMPEGRAKDVELGRVMRVISDKVPKDIIDKSRALRNIALLGNSKTFARNIVGNALMGVADNVANVVGTPIDYVMSKFTGKRTTALPSLITQAKGSVRGTKEAISDAFGGLSIKDLKGKTLKEKGQALVDGFSNPIDSRLVSEGKFETGRGLVFKSKPMRLAENAVNTSLALGDKPFSEAYYDDVLRQIMKANKVTEATEEMKQIARQVAEERTYQDTNTISKYLTALRNIPKNNGKSKGHQAAQLILDSLMPYVKTPANIIKRGLEYSPMGIGEGITKLISNARKGKLDMSKQREIVDRFARGITGTGIGAGGYYAAKNGLSTGEADMDKDSREFKKTTGEQSNSIKVGDRYINYNWAQPVSTPFGLGTQLKTSHKDGKNIPSSIIDSIMAAGNYYAEQPMLQGLQRAIGGQNDTKSAGERAMDVLYEMPKQFIPPSVVKQVRQFVDPIDRETYSPDYFTKTLVNPIKSRTPYLSKSLEPKISVTGEEVKLYQGDNNAFNILANPATVTKVNKTPEQEEIMRLYKENGDKAVFPTAVDKSIQYKKERYQLTEKEFTQFQRETGVETMKMIKEEMSNPYYQNLSDEERVELIKDIISEAKKKAKENILTGRGIEVE